MEEISLLHVLLSLHMRGRGWRVAWYRLARKQGGGTYIGLVAVKGKNKCVPAQNRTANY